MDDPVSVPIGFWLRTVDSLFDSSMDDLFAAEGVTRQLWQVLNSIKRNEPASTRDLDAAMAMFLGEHGASCMSLLDDLGRRGWIGGSEGIWALTDAGRCILASLEKKVMGHRELMFGGVSETDYRTTVETLARIAKNLDPQSTRSVEFR